MPQQLHRRLDDLAGDSAWWVHADAQGTLVWADAKIVDGLVTGSADGIGELSGELRRPQTGFVRSYALMVLGGALVVLVGLLAVTLA